MAIPDIKRVGDRGETLAAEHFERLGYRILSRNYRTRYGELDLVLADPERRTIVFCEVKTRTLGSGGTPWDGLHGEKRKQVRRMAAAWVAAVRDRPYHAELRFDAVGVTLDRTGALVRLDHLEAAF
jgi:putative endonuclease